MDNGMIQAMILALFMYLLTAGIKAEHGIWWALLFAIVVLVVLSVIVFWKEIKQRISGG